MAGCPNDDEIERPTHMMELVSGEESWKEIGLRISWTEPSLPSEVSLTLGQPLRIRVCIEAKKDVSDSDDEIAAFCWTNVKFAENACGVWKDIKLFENPKCRTKSEPGIVKHIFQGSLAPDKNDMFRITFNIKWKQFMVWANQFKVDTLLHVMQNRSGDGQIPVNVPVNFPCDCNIEHGDQRSLSMPDPSTPNRKSSERANARSGSHVAVPATSVTPLGSEGQESADTGVESHHGSIQEQQSYEEEDDRGVYVQQETEEVVHEELEPEEHQVVQAELEPEEVVQAELEPEEPPAQADGGETNEELAEEVEEQAELQEDALAEEALRKSQEQEEDVELLVLL